MEQEKYERENVYRASRFGKKRRRVVLEFHPERYAELEAVMEDAGIGSAQELLDWATALLEWAVEEKAKQRQVASFDPATGQYTTLHMKFLDCVAMANRPAKVVA